MLAQRRLGTAATCAAVLPASADPQQRTLLLGYADGAVRLARLCNDGWLLLDAARPHKVPGLQLLACQHVSSLRWLRDHYPAPACLHRRPAWHAWA